MRAIDGIFHKMKSSLDRARPIAGFKYYCCDSYLDAVGSDTQLFELIVHFDKFNIKFFQSQWHTNHSRDILYVIPLAVGDGDLVTQDEYADALDVLWKMRSKYFIDELKEAVILANMPQEGNICN